MLLGLAATPMVFVCVCVLEESGLNDSARDLEARHKHKDLDV